MAGISEQDKIKNRLNQLHVEVLGRLKQVLHRQKNLYKRIIVRRSNLLARQARRDISSNQSDSGK